MSTPTDFAKICKSFGVKSEVGVREVFVRGTVEVQRSVKTGSELTGSPGQPVDTANLRNSWTPRFLSDTEWETTTNVAYAQWIEDGGNDLGPFTLRSEVGGFHSVKLTEAGWDRIVDFAARSAAKGGTT